MREHQEKVIASQNEFNYNIMEKKQKILNIQEDKMEALVKQMGVNILYPDIRTKPEGPKYTLRAKTTKTNKGMKVPGPGKYETDVVPPSVAIPQYSIGTSQRSNLGMNSIATDFNYNIDKADKRKYAYSIPKDKKLKEGAEDNGYPGPAAYQVESAIGSVPKYLIDKTKAKITI